MSFYSSEIFKNYYLMHKNFSRKSVLSKYVIDAFVGDRITILLSTILSKHEMWAEDGVTRAIGFSPRRENRIEIEIATR